MGEGGGEGRGGNEIWQIRLRGPDSGPHVNCACSKFDLFSTWRFVLPLGAQTSISITRCVLHYKIVVLQI